jgi:hypothetical protein
MNVNSGGPHILLFERDQQLTGLLMSEFQLAGYECHAARTAVEVFDAIARFPIRLVLVNLAQAAANRREFWVALDAQRRGRGVQVFTFRCMNLAGYGPDDPEERSRAVLTDMEVDGMMGVMNLVDAVRARIPGSTTGSFSRLRTQSTATSQNAPRSESLERSHRQPDVDVRGVQATAQPTASMSVLMASNSAGSANPVSQPEPGISPRTEIPAPTFTDKIRAVIYPGNRSYSPTPEVNWAPHAVPPTPTAPRPVSNPDMAIRPQVNPNASDVGRATGLEQLSRMVRENPPTWTSDAPPAKAGSMEQPVAVPAPTQEREEPYKGPQTDQVVMNNVIAESTPAQQAMQPIEPKSIGDFDLRAFPIEDMPGERASEKRAVPSATQPSQTQALDALSNTSPQPAVHPASAFKAPVPPTPVQIEVMEKVGENDTGKERGTIETEQDKAVDRLLVEQVPVLPSMLRGRIDPPATSEDVLLNIVQSLPPMTALPTPPSSQTPVLSGRATRSLGNVLLEGHLVPQHRLEVAQNIQRMLRGVDLNYQLGEILLMFKLLTPDQLLAASLVSYGLISASQISGLGRVRQELHLMGLEYDLESLLVLFRILSSEQLREVRASWSS